MERLSRMRSWIKKITFSVHVAWRNMRIHPFRTILLWVGFLGVSISILLALSMTSIFHTFFYGNIAETYQDIDLQITADTDSQTRFFSTSFLDDQIDEITDGVYPFFEYDALVEVSENDRMYARIYASSIDMLNHLSDSDQIISEPLSDQEVVVTASYAKHHQLDIGDALTLQAGGQSKAFYIVAIFEDGKLFSGESIFIDKQASLSFFLASLDPTLEDLPDILLRNIYNVLYVDLKSDVTHEDAVYTFQHIIGYETLKYHKTIDDVYINQMVERDTALLGALLSFVFVAITLVLLTTLKYFFYDRKQQITTIRILGGKNTFGLTILGVELLIEQFVAFIVAVILTNICIRLGMQYLESAWIYQLTSMRIGLAAIITLIMFISMFAYIVYQSKQTTDIRQLKLGGDELKLNVKMHVILATIIIAIYSILYIKPLTDLLGFNASVIRVILSAIFLLLIGLILLYGVMKVFKRFREKTKLYYHLKILINNKGFSHYFSVMLIVSLVMFLLIFMVQHLDQRIETIQNEYDFDIIVTRVLEDEDTIYNHISSMDHVASVQRADIYESVEVEAEQMSIGYVMSMDLDEVDTFFNIIDLEEVMPLLERESEPAILLPRSFEDIHQYEIGDRIELSINQHTFIVAGFFEKQGLSVAFTNLYMVDEQIREHANSMLVKASGDVTLLQNQLLDTYSSQMIIVFDFWTLYLEPFIFSMIRIKNFIIGYICLVIACFIMTLANHQTMMLIEREADDARMLAIGYDMKTLRKDTVVVGFIIMVVALITSMVSYLLMVGQMEGLFAAFGAYEHIVFKSTSIGIGLGINIFLFTVMWLLRIIRQPNVHIIDYMRTY